VNCRELSFTKHSLQRMFSRSIPPEQVRQIVNNGEKIIEYPDDTPYPSTLLLGYVGSRPIHVLVGRDSSMAICYIITVYEPDPMIWEDNFKNRRQQ